MYENALLSYFAANVLAFLQNGHCRSAPDGEKNAAGIIAACREKGVLVIKAKDKLRLLPALNIPMDQLAKAIAVIKECCAG